MSQYFEQAPTRVLYFDSKKFTEIHNDTFVCHDDFSTISRGKRNKWYYRAKGEDSHPIQIDLEKETAC